MVRLEGPSLIKERSSRPSDRDPPITQHSHLIGPLYSPSYQSPFSCLRVYLPVLVVCVLTTHIGFRCIRCVVIVLHFSSWADDPHFLLSSFNPYLSDPLTLLLLTHLSHDVVFLLFSLSHDLIVVLLILQS